MIYRLLTKKMQSPPKSVLLLGPRQTGKSTLVKSLRPELSINLANERDFLRHSVDPGLLESLIVGQRPATVFIDEVQRLPSLLNNVQDLIDNPRNEHHVTFYLTGSSARKLRRADANLLPGRLFTYRLGGLCAQELNYELDIERALRTGFLPEPYLCESRRNCEKLLESYASTYLKEEIQSEALTRNLPGFARFLTTVAVLSGAIIDYSKVSSKAKVSRSGCLRFMEILEDTLIASRIYPFDESPDVDSIKHPKLYFFDGGVLNGLLGSFDTSVVRRGALFEQLVYSQLINSSASCDRRLGISFFRTRGGVEVDFVITLGGKVWAVEAKAGEVDKRDLDGLRRFQEYYPTTHRCIVVSPSEPKRQVDGILICGVADMLRELGL